MSRPFDAITYPKSPISAVTGLRADGRDSVVSLSGSTAAQSRSYRAGQLDMALTLLASQTPPPHAIFATGSAGSGKSAAVEAQARAHRALYSAIVEDATHSDSPRLGQAETLELVMDGLANGGARPARPVLVAANTGMLLNLFAAWGGPAGRFSELERAVMGPLGLADAAPAGDLRIHVLNLDDRPTAGPGGLLSEMLPQFDPDDPEGLMAGAGRCASCQVRDWCPARTNAALVSGPAADAVALLAAAAAMERGRHDSARALWDWTSRIVAPPTAFDGFDDPCDAVAEAAATEDHAWRLRHLLPISVFAASGDLGRRIAALDPSLAPTERAYKMLSFAAIEPDVDARNMLAVGLSEPRAEALAAAARASEGPHLVDHPDEGVTDEWRDLLAVAATGSAMLASPSEWPIERDAAGRRFASALDAYAAWQSSEGPGPRGSAAHDRQVAEHLEPVVLALGEGLARLFGVVAEGRLFLPLRSYNSRHRSLIHVEVHVDLETATPRKDLPTDLNRDASASVGHRPLSIRLTLPEGEMTVDLPAYRLLLSASEEGLTAAVANNERFHALRRAAETFARSASARDDARLLVEEDGRSYLVTQAHSLGGTRPLRARMVTT